ncbi:hypothetical protein BSSX_3957 [Bacillus subtilis]|nr:hypothetical protein I653_18460 [Bacillus subtilis subsp. subtilis str. BAB-1]ASK25821.1 hypothetical protein BSSX_3957 [Bacillus subtilis]
MPAVYAGMHFLFQAAFTPIILFSDKSFLHKDNHDKKKNDKMTSASILKGRGR